MKFRALAVATLAAAFAVAPVLANAADRGGRHHHHHKPRVSIGVGVGFGGFWNPYPYEPFDDPFYDHYPPQVWGYVPPPAVPCTPADVPTKEPSTNIFSPDYTYDRIDASRCAPQAAATVPPALVTPSGQVQQPGTYYFCRSAKAYYPQVAQCAEGWQQVAPKPPGT
jgi:hypothetical protein